MKRSRFLAGAATVAVAASIVAMAGSPAGATPGVGGSGPAGGSGAPAAGSTAPSSRAWAAHAAPRSASAPRPAIVAGLSAAAASIPAPMSPSAQPAHLDPALNQVAGLPGPSTSSVPVAADGTVEVTVRGSGAAAAAWAEGGRVLAQHSGSVTVSIAPARLRGLANRAGVSLVRRAVRAMPLSTSEGVAASGAQNWMNAGNVGNGGQGVSIGIVDAGFAGLSDEIAAGNLGNIDSVNYPQGQDHCANDSVTAHGTAVAEIVHQMAPQATLYLYCIDDSTGFAQAADQVVASGVKIVNSSLGFTAESRGDGFGQAGSTEVAVRGAREAGVLWVQSAGNSAADHWSGALADSNHDSLVDLYGTAHQVDAIAQSPASNGVAPSGTIVLSWDQWPSSNLGVSLIVQETDDTTGAKIGPPVVAHHVNGDDPTLEIDVRNTSTTRTVDFDVSVGVTAGTSPVRYDLTYGGEVSSSYFNYLNAARAATGSILEPATSPWVVAVGAADWSSKTLESFSSQGPTIDGRIKPDLLGFDGVSSNISSETSTDPNTGITGFYGTSAAAPHVAGAAALIAAANPTMGASDIEAFLERRASPLANPPTNLAGHGLLQLGSPSAISPVAASGYVPLAAPARIVDTRSGLGGHKGALGTGAVIAVTLPSSVPANASSVVLNVTGINAKGTTYFAVYGDTFSGSTNLTLTATDPNAAVAAVVKVNSAHGFKLLNRVAAADAVVDVVGYFAAPGSTGTQGYSPVAPTRLVDTRLAIGAPKAKLAPNGVLKVTVAGRNPVPANATAAVINLTALNESAPGYLMAYPNAPAGTSSLDYRKFSRSNLAIVNLAADGSFTLQNRVATIDAIVDVVGYFSPTATGRFVTLPAPISVVDTRNGKGGRIGALGADATLAVDGAGRFGVPSGAVAVWAGYDALAVSGAGYLSVYAGDASPPHTSNLDYSAGRAVANAVIANLAPASSQWQYDTVNRVGTANLTQDLFGYFTTGP